MKWLAALLLIAAPAVAQAQTVTIARGEAVTLTQDDGGVWGVDRKAAPDATPDEASTAAKFVRGDMNDAVGPNVKPIPADPNAPPPMPQKGKLRLHFVKTPGADQSMLVIENGYDRGMVYRATIRVGDRSGPTDVCLVMPGRLGYEHWPYAIDALVLSDIRLVPWKDGDPVPCE